MIKKNRKLQLHNFFEKLYSFLLEAVSRILEISLFLLVSLPSLLVVFLVKLSWNCLFLGFVLGNNGADKLSEKLFIDKE